MRLQSIDHLLTTPSQKTSVSTTGNQLVALVNRWLHRLWRHPKKAHGDSLGLANCLYLPNSTDYLRVVYLARYR